MVADLHTRCSSSPRRISIVARVYDRFPSFQRMQRIRRRIHPSRSSRICFTAERRKYASNRAAVDSFPRWHSSGCARVRAASSKLQSPSRFLLFEPSSGSNTLLCSRLTSAKAFPYLSARIARGGAGARCLISPGSAHRPSRVCPPHLHRALPDRYWTLKIFAFSSGHVASYPVSVRRARVLLAASSRFHLAVDTLAVRLTIPSVGSSRGLAPPTLRELPGAQVQKAPLSRGLLSVQQE